MLKKIFFIFVFAATALVCTDKSLAFVQQKGTDKVAVQVMSGRDQYNPRYPLEVLVRFDMKDGWHIFSETPSIAGFPTKVEWKLPDGFGVENIRWSKDKKFVTEGIEQYGYGDTAYYAAKIVPPVSGWEKDVPLRAKISWLACREECAPETVFVEFILPYSEHDLLENRSFMSETAAAEKSFNEIPQEDSLQTSQKTDNLFYIILLAFFGGIVLNFMPCVFPILSLKAIALAQSLNDVKKSRIEALFYSVGVVICFMLAASVLFIFRMQGEQIGWGFQLQSPVFVAVMLIIFAVIFLLLLDVVHVQGSWINRLGLISLKNSAANAFLTGFFAVLIASPCTAPFMGIAIGYALASPLYVYYPVFLALGAGYALPFALAGFFPSLLRRILPKPGKWMDILKKLFAIPVFLTCVWLGWVLYNQLSPAADTVSENLTWAAYDEQEIAELRKQGRPVFVDFTAKWCLTCLLNKKAALQSSSFEKLAQKHKIALFRADWTSKDENISKALETFGRNSVPLYVYYHGHNEEYQILPQLLTPGILEEYLK